MRFRTFKVLDNEISGRHLGVISLVIHRQCSHHWLHVVLALFETSNYIFLRILDRTSAFQAVRNGISQIKLVMM